MSLLSSWQCADKMKGRKEERVKALLYQSWEEKGNDTGNLVCLPFPHFTKYPNFGGGCLMEEEHERLTGRLPPFVVLCYLRTGEAQSFAFPPWRR